MVKLHRVSNLVKISQTVDEIWLFLYFSKMGPSAILDLLCARLDHPRRAFDGIYAVQNLVLNRRSSFDDMQVLTFI